MTGLLIGASLAVLTAFFVVLCGFLHSLTRVLARSARRLDAVSATANQIRRDCAAIGPAVGAMNLNLYGVAANLAEIGDLSEDLAHRSTP